MRLFTLLIPLLFVQNAVIASNHDTGSSGEEPRSAISIFRYRGVAPDTSSSEQFDRFVGSIETRFYGLREHFAEQLDQGDESRVVQYIDSISIDQIKNEEPPGSNSLVRDWLRAEVDLLQVLRGTMFTTPQGVPNLVTRSHFIEDPEQGNLRTFQIKLKMSEDEYANTRDSHSLVILYSIAIEAKRMGVERSQIAVVIAFALDAIADLERRGGPLQGEMLKIKNAWLDFKNAL